MSQSTILAASRRGLLWPRRAAITRQAGALPVRALAVAVVAACPALLAWAVFGPLLVEDSHGYLDYAAALRQGAIPAGATLLGEAAVPTTLFRIGGYPAVLTALQTILPDDWLNALVLFQVIAQAAVAAASYVAARALGIRHGLAMASSLLPATGFAVVAQVCVLSDALSAALITGAALTLLIMPRFAAAVAAGLCLALATAMREATLFVAVGFLPLAFDLPGSVRRRVAAASIIVLLPCGVCLGQVGWNVARGAGLVFTTSPQTQMVQAVLPLLRDGYSVYDGDDVFDATARATVGTGEYLAINELHRRLFLAGMTAPDMASIATRRYFSAWRRFPFAMAGATLGNFRAGYLAMPLQPFATIGDLRRFAGSGSRSPRANSHPWRLAQVADVGAAGLALLDLLTRTAGIVVSLLGMIGPWFLSETKRLRALWCACAGLVAVYLPVHIEPRYMMPIIPLVTLMAAAVANRFIIDKLLCRLRN